MLSSFCFNRLLKVVALSQFKFSYLLVQTNFSSGLESHTDMNVSCFLLRKPPFLCEWEGIPKNPFQLLWCQKLIFLKWGSEVRALRDLTQRNVRCLFWTCLRRHFGKGRGCRVRSGREGCSEQQGDGSFRRPWPPTSLPMTSPTLLPLISLESREQPFGDNGWCSQKHGYLELKDPLTQTLSQRNRGKIVSV